MGQEWENMTIFVKTCWLSLETCCSIEFKKFPLLKSMFISRTNHSLSVNKEKGTEKEEGKILKICFRLQILLIKQSST